LTLLSACTTTPRLATSADDLSGAPYQASNITLSNAGGRVLYWTFETDNPHVTLRNQFGATVKSGGLRAGERVTLHIVIEGRLVDPAVGLNATLIFTSNGGGREVPYSAGARATCAGPVAGRAGSSAAQPEAVGSQILVTYRLPREPGPFAATSTDATAQRAHLANQARLTLTSDHDLTTLEAAGGAGPDLLVAREGVDVDALVARLAADPLVAAVQRNYYVELQWNGGAPADPLYDAQWTLAEFGVPEAWAALTAPAERQVVLAVLDSGVDSHHPDLAAKLLPGYDFFRNSPTAYPPPVLPGTGSFGNVAHGTHVAGIAAALGDDVGIIGVAFAPEVRLLPVKLFDDCGERGRVDTLVKAIRWATGLPVAGAPLNENPANIINLSLGVPGRHPVLDDATTAAWEAGVLLVAASGNNSGGVLSPGNAPEVLAVGSVDQDRERSDFSNFGPGLDLMAPGGYGAAGGDADLACAASGSSNSSGSVISTVPQMPNAPPELGYACFAGTSMAAPFVSGVAALLFAQDATRTAADVRELLRTTARFEAHMNGYEYGAGIVCADAALGAATQCGSP